MITHVFLIRPLILREQAWPLGRTTAGAMGQQRLAPKTEGSVLSCRLEGRAPSRPFGRHGHDGAWPSKDGALPNRGSVVQARKHVIRLADGDGI